MGYYYFIATLQKCSQKYLFQKASNVFIMQTCFCLFTTIFSPQVFTAKKLDILVKNINKIRIFSVMLKYINCFPRCKIYHFVNEASSAQTTQE